MRRQAGFHMPTHRELELMEANVNLPGPTKGLERIILLLQQLHYFFVDSKLSLL